MTGEQEWVDAFAEEVSQPGLVSVCAGLAIASPTGSMIAAGSPPLPDGATYVLVLATNTVADMLKQWVREHSEQIAAAKTAMGEKCLLIRPPPQ